MNAGGSETTSAEPSVVGVRVRPLWSVVLYALLVLAAGVALYAQRAPNVDATLSRAAPWLFLIFALGFATYRIALVAARRYSPFKAFIQIFLAALFFLTLLFPRSTVVAGRSLTAHPEARVRAAAAELAGWRGDQGEGHVLVGLLDDADPDVRRSAHEALVKLNAGQDLGAPESLDARKSWGARFP